MEDVKIASVGWGVQNNQVTLSPRKEFPAKSGGEGLCVIAHNGVTAVGIDKEQGRASFCLIL